MISSYSMRKKGSIREFAAKLFSTELFAHFRFDQLRDEPLDPTAEFEDLLHQR